MKKLCMVILYVLATALSAPAAMAQTRIVRGEGFAAVQGWLATGPSEEDRSSALKAAKLAAWRSYSAQAGQSEIVDQIRANESFFLDHLDEVLVDLVTVDESYNKDSKRYNIKIKATVSESAIGSLIRGLAKGGNSNPVAGAGASVLGNGPIMVLGMAREADVVKSFQEKQTNVSELSAESETTKTKSVAMTTVRTKEVTGGNVERKRDKITYKIGNVGILNSKLPRILLQNGIKASPYAFIMKPCKLPNPDSFSKQYASSEIGELPSKVLADIQQNLAGCGKVRYWVFASMDVGGYGTDPNTGLTLATVSITVNMYEVDSGIQLASVSKDVSGRSADQSDAIRSASDMAIQAAGDIITAQVAALK